MNPNKGSAAYAWAWRVITAYLGLIVLAVALVLLRGCSA